MTHTPAWAASLESSAKSLRVAAELPWELHLGNALDVVPTLGYARFRCIVTSPPYFLKRAYDIPPSAWADPTCSHEWHIQGRKGLSGGSGDASAKLKARKNVANFQIVPNQTQARCLHCNGWMGQLGLEPELSSYIDNLRALYNACRNALTPDGTLWIVIDDSYAGSGRGPSGQNAMVKNQTRRQGFDSPGAYTPDGMKPKDMLGVPYELARALRSDGWYWRADIIWHKPNGMPSSQLDRPTHSYEHVLMFSKSRSYYANHLGLSEPAVTTKADAPRTGTKYLEFRRPGRNYDDSHGLHRNGREASDTRVLRDVWSIGTEPTGHEHFAAYPTELARRCVRIGSEVGDLVLDPCAGISRTGLAALQLRRGFVGVDLGRDYLAWGAEGLREYSERGVLHG